MSATRKALTVLRSPDPADVGVSLTHRQLLAEITRAANMFRALGLTPGQRRRGLPGADAARAAGRCCLARRWPALRVRSTTCSPATRSSTCSTPSRRRSWSSRRRELDETCWSKAAGVFDQVPTLEHVIVIGGDGERPRRLSSSLDEAIGGDAGDALDFEPSADRDTVCALFHTGGTTGRPKLVRLTHGNQIHAAFGFAQVFGYDERDIVINGFPFFHVGGTMTVGLSVLAAGGHIVVPSPYGLRAPSGRSSDYWQIVEQLRRDRRRRRADLDRGADQQLEAGQRRLVRAGWPSPAAPCCRRRSAARFEATTGIRLFETYGMTETAAAIAFNPGRGDAGRRQRRLSCALFRDPHHPPRCRNIRASAAPNESGLVQVRGPQVFPGYLDPAHNEGTLDADGWLTTGDVGYLTEDAAARPDRTGEGSDRPQRPQYRSGGDRGRRQPVSQACRSARRSACPTSMPARYRRCSSCRRPVPGRPRGAEALPRRTCPRTAGATEEHPCHRRAPGDGRRQDLQAGAARSGDQGKGAARGRTLLWATCICVCRCPPRRAQTHDRRDRGVRREASHSPNWTQR